MLPQKTSWRIKRLISHRKHDANNKTTSSEHSKLKAEDLLEGTSKRASWTFQSPTIEIPLLRRTSSTATTRTPRMASTTQTSRTAHSSASSLCSCDCDLDVNKKNPLLPSVPNITSRSQASYSPTKSSSPKNCTNWRLKQFSDQRSVSRPTTKSLSTTSIATIALGSTFDLLEALTIDLIDDENAPKQLINNTEEQDSGGELSPNVEQLIRETDEAFKAVGAALASVNSSSEGWYNTDTKLVEKDTRSHSHSLKITSSYTPSLVFDPVVSISMSEPKSKRKKFTKRKKNILGKALHAFPLPPGSTQTRWMVTEVTNNVADVFSGKRFRIEVDEILTSGQMNSTVKVDSERRMSVDSTKTIETEASTPTEPFHLESLSNRITAAQRKPFPPSPARAPPEIPKAVSSDSNIIDTPGTEMVFNNVSFPIPPRTPRRSSVTRNIPLLPTILENQAYSKKKFRTTPRYGRQPFQTYVLLPSTEFTLVAPLFRQGPIRIEHSPPGRSDLSPEEEPLNWTAFHMAISGMDEYMIGEEWQYEEAELAETIKWWRSYGFEEFEKIQRMKSLKSAVIPTVQSFNQQPDLSARNKCSKWLPLNQTMEEMESMDRVIKRHTKEEEDTNKIPYEDVKPTTVQRCPPAADSLPPSPMLNFSLPSHGEDDTIPMGFNLGHDLGDFLNWEANNVQTFIDW